MFSTNRANYKFLTLIVIVFIVLLRFCLPLYLIKIPSVADVLYIDFVLFREKFLVKTISKQTDIETIFHTVERSEVVSTSVPFDLMGGQSCNLIFYLSNNAQYKIIFSALEERDGKQYLLLSNGDLRYLVVSSSTLNDLWESLDYPSQIFLDKYPNESDIPPLGIQYN